MAIRIYIFFCENCNYEFEEFVDWDKISNYKPKCSMCKSNKEVYRNFGSEKIMTDDGVPKTVGMLADMNAKKRGIKIEGRPPKLEL